MGGAIQLALSQLCMSTFFFGQNFEAKMAEKKVEEKLPQVL